MTRTGKIARLPKAIRDQLNQNLADGVPGVRLVEWLNTLPEVQQVLTDHFDGREINEVNLSEWKAGGFLDWQVRQDMLASAKELAEEAEDIKAATPGGLADHLSVVLAARYAQLLNGWNGEVDEGFQKKLKVLRLMGQDIAVLRRGDLRAERLALEKEKWVEKNKDDEAKALECCLDECKEWPEVTEAFTKVFVLNKEYQVGKRTNREYEDRERQRLRAEAERRQQTRQE